MNAMEMMHIMGALKTFQDSHPGFTNYLKDMYLGGIEEGTVIEITTTKPGCQPVTGNMKVKQSDLELFESLKNMSGK